MKIQQLTRLFTTSFKETTGTTTVKVKETKGYTSMNKSVEERNYFLKVALNMFFFFWVTFYNQFI